MKRLAMGPGPVLIPASALILPLVLALTLTAVLTARPARAEAGLSAAEKGEFALNVALPSPSEMFLALDKLGGADWGPATVVHERYDYGSPYARGLNLGVRAADGLVAILARDRNKLGGTITVVTTLAEELMIRDSILERSKNFEQMAADGEWKRLRDELESLRYDIELELDQMGDSDVALLIRAGGWLRAMQATADIFLTRPYPENVSSMFYQPDLVDYFAGRMLAMEPAARNNPVVREIILSLPEMRQLVDVGFGRPVPRANIEQLARLGGRLVKLIEEAANG
ncbi:MAG: hypothetical protein AB7D57_15455 [Desulfovibrionaceae bacterium]